MGTLSPAKPWRGAPVEYWAERALPEEEWADVAAGRPVALIVVEDSLAALQRLSRYWRQRMPARGGRGNGQRW
jgi:hypothetical protein